MLVRIATSGAGLRESTRSLDERRYSWVSGANQFKDVPIRAAGCVRDPDIAGLIDRDAAWIAQQVVLVAGCT